MTIDQPNLQAILFKYLQDHAKAQAHDRLQEHNNADNEAIDAIYAGLLAEVIGEANCNSGTPEQNYYGNLIVTQAQLALKRWCYGENTSNE